MALIVQKYGGSSLSDKSRREIIINKIKASLNKGDKLIVVVSAMGRLGSPYATDSLLALLDEAAANSATENFSASGIAKDMIASCGELISATYIATMLGASGVKAVPLSAYTAGIRASGPYGDADLTDIDSERILTIVNSGSVPIVAGFQAVSLDGNLVTIGRGGSDTSAVAIAAYCKADYVDIFTDVPGVAMADPKIVPDAPWLNRLDYASMYRLASKGARVLHDRSAILAERFGVKIRIRSSFEEGEGTIVSSKALDSSAPFLLGIAVKTIDNISVISIVCREGMGTIVLDSASKLASKLDLKKAEDPSLKADPDSFSYICPADNVKNAVQTLLKALL